jgi:hypothetical protein
MEPIEYEIELERINGPADHTSPAPTRTKIDELSGRNTGLGEPPPRCRPQPFGARGAGIFSMRTMPGKAVERVGDRVPRR